MNNKIFNAIDRFLFLGGKGGAGQQAAAGRGVDEANIVQFRMNVRSHSLLQPTLFGVGVLIKGAEDSRVAGDVKKKHLIAPEGTSV